MNKLRVLLTGAAGRIGQHLLPVFREHYELTCLDCRPVPGADDAVLLDLSRESPELARALRGVEVVVHLAANPRADARFLPELLPSNIVAPYRLFQAAAEAGVRRIVFASSCHAVFAYPAGAHVSSSSPVRPGDLYGVTKVFGEALGRYYHERYGLEFVAIRIGAFARGRSRRIGPNSRWRQLWLGPNDCRHLFQSAVDTPDVGYALVSGTSAGNADYLTHAEARLRLGFVPTDTIDD